MKHIYLIGMMGCGKSTCASALGRILGRDVLDTDAEIEKNTGMTVSEIFAKYGEEHFRDLETALCRALTEQTDFIVATGGGLPLRQENRDLLKKSGTVVFLNRDPQEIFTTGDMSSRPLGQQGEAAFVARFAQRLPLYRAAADLEITNFSDLSETVTEILEQLEDFL